MLKISYTTVDVSLLFIYLLFKTGNRRYQRLNPCTVVLGRGGAIAFLIVKQGPAMKSLGTTDLQGVKCITCKLCLCDIYYSQCCD